MKKFLCLLSLVACVFQPASATTVTVPGTACPWLAGAEAGTTGPGGYDNVPDEAPAVLAVQPGQRLSFTVTGGTNFAGDGSNLVGGEGIDGYDISDSAINGVGGISFVPVSSLIGVFLTDGVPSSSDPYPPDLQFDGDKKDYSILAPLLRQPFFIGDGRTSGGDVQHITVPAGATKLYLGTVDGSGWYNNVGSLSVTVTPGPGDNIQIDFDDIEASPHALIGDHYFDTKGVRFFQGNDVAGASTGIALDNGFPVSAEVYNGTGVSAPNSLIPAYTTNNDIYVYFYTPAGAPSTASSVTIHNDAQGMPATIRMQGFDGSDQPMGPATEATGAGTSLTFTGSNIAYVKIWGTTTDDYLGLDDFSAHIAGWDPHLDFSATGPASAGAPIHFTASIGKSWSVRVQKATVASPAESDWSDLEDGNGGHMTQAPAGSGQFVLDSAAYPAGDNISFRAIAAQTGQADVISAPLSGYTLQQAALSIGASIASTSDFVNGRTAYIDDYLIFKLTFKNSGDANAKALRVSAKVPSFISADVPLMVRTTIGSNVVTLASGDTSSLSTGGSFTTGPGLGGNVIGNTDGTHVYIPGDAAITEITDATHFKISKPALNTSGTKIVSTLVQYNGRRVQFAASDLSLSPGGTYIPETSPGAGDARLQWDVGDLPGAAGLVYSQYVSFAAHLTGKVKVGQDVGILTDYSVSSTSTPPQPGVGATGDTSHSPPVSSHINGSISFLLNPLATTVAPGGYLTYVFSLTNKGSTTATNPVAEVDVPDNTRFALSYANGAKSVALIGTGTFTYKQVYRTGSLSPQVVVQLPPIPAKTTFQLKVTFQAKWVSPTDVPKITSLNYSAAFLDPKSTPSAVTQFTSWFNAAGTTPPPVSGTPETLTTDKVTNAAISLPSVGFNVNVASGTAPLSSTFSNITTGTVKTWKWDFGDGTTSTAQTPPAHVYAKPGVYAVSLTATNTGGSRTVTHTNAVIVTSADFYALISDPGGKVATTANQSGNVDINVRGTLDGRPKLAVFKTISNTVLKTENSGDGDTVDFVKPGDQLNFLIMAVNTGDSPADEVYVQDAMPDSTSFVSAALTGATTPSKTKSTLATIQDPDHHHLIFSGLHLEPHDSVSLLLTVQVSPALVAPAPTDPPLYLDVGQFSIGSGSTTATPAGYATASLIEVLGTVTYAQPRLSRYIAMPVTTSDVTTTRNTLNTLYAKTPSAAPLTNAKDPLSYIPGVQRYYVHYENIGNGGASGFKLTVPVPAGTAFYRASWVTLTSGQLPGTLIAVPKGGSLSYPAQLATSGNVVFGLGTLAAGGKGDVMVEVIIGTSAITANSNHVGDSSQTITITDSQSNIVTGSAPGSLAGRSIMGGGLIGPLQAHASSLTLEEAEILDAAFTKPVVPGQQVPALGFMRSVSSTNIAPGDQFTITLTTFNYGELGCIPLVNFQVPSNSKLISIDLGPAGVYVPQPADAVAGTTGSFVAVSNNAPSYPQGSPSLTGHTASALTMTLEATGGVGTSIVDDGNFVVTSNHDKVYAAPVTINIVDSASLPQLSQESHTQVFGHSFSNLNNGAVLIDIGGNNIVAQGGGNIVAQGGGNIVAQGGGNLVNTNGSNIVVTGAGNLIAVQNPSSLGFTAVGGLLANNSYAITNAKLGNFVVQNTNAIVAQGGGNIVAQGGGNIVAQGGGNIVAQGGGNLVSQLAGSIVAQGGGNIVAQGGGNIVAAAGGNIVAQGGGNIVAQGGGNVVAQGGGNIVAQGGGNVVPRTGGVTAVGVR